jgi:hypothetical protein
MKLLFKLLLLLLFLLLLLSAIVYMINISTFKDRVLKSELKTKSRAAEKNIRELEQEIKPYALYMIKVKKDLDRQTPLKDKGKINSQKYYDLAEKYIEFNQVYYKTKKELNLTEELNKHYKKFI